MALGFYPISGAPISGLPPAAATGTRMPGSSAMPLFPLMLRGVRFFGMPFFPSTVITTRQPFPAGKPLPVVMPGSPPFTLPWQFPFGGRGLAQPNPPPKPMPRTASMMPFLSREVGTGANADMRRRRASEILSSVHNSLVRQGILVQTGPEEFSVHAPVFVAARPPVATDDSTTGAFVGATWIDSGAHRVYFCVYASPGVAVWRGPF